VGDFRRRLVHGLPSVGRRAARLQERAGDWQQVRKQVAEAKQRVKRSAAALQGAEGPGSAGPEVEPHAALKPPLPASFRRQLLDLRRTLSLLNSMDPERLHPQWQLTYKLRTYRLAESHGILVPRVYESWSELEELDLSALPDEFVLKTDRGHSSQGVFPLRRVEGGAFELLDGTRRFTAQELTTRLASPKAGKPPYFAEEVLVQPEGGPIPDDVKIYCAYGRILHVMLRRMPKHGNLTAARYRYLDEHGNDLGNVAPRQRIDDTVPIPESLGDMVAAARHLSRAVGVPFSRVDLYDTDHGVVLGEITQSPGGAQLFSAEHDRWMGRMWDRARWQLDLEILEGRPPGILYGSHPAPNPYPAGHVSTLTDPGTWAVRQVPCEEWCFRPPLATGSPSRPGSGKAAGSGQG
jgi:hypothetical protein